MNSQLLCMLRFSLVVLALFMGAVFCTTTEDQAVMEEEWVELFSGENLDGWDFKITGYVLNENYANTVRVEDGLLKVRYDE